MLRKLSGRANQPTKPFLSSLLAITREGFGWYRSELIKNGEMHGNKRQSRNFYSQIARRPELTSSLFCGKRPFASEKTRTTPNCKRLLLLNLACRILFAKKRTYLLRAQKIRRNITGDEIRYLTVNAWRKFKYR